MPTDGSRPDEAAIRRALAECMTVSDIDDAMGWPPGTARRRRWRSPDRGGLPNADAELGGTALWFRSTFEAWQLALGTRRPRRGDIPTTSPETEPAESSDEQEPADPPTASGPEVGDAEATTIDAGAPLLDAELDRGGVADRAESTEPAPAIEIDGPAADTTSAAGIESGDDPHDDVTAVPSAPLVAPSAVTSVHDLAVGQRVLAEVRGGWRDAVIAHRDRTTVVVEYQVSGSPLGTRRQRVGADRVRIPDND